MVQLNLPNYVEHTPDNNFYVILRNTSAYQQKKIVGFTNTYSLIYEPVHSDKRGHMIQPARTILSPKAITYTHVYIVTSYLTLSSWPLF